MKPNDIRVSARYTVSSEEFIKDKSMVKDFADNYLRQTLADRIVYEKSKRTDFPDAHYYELALDLYVATPEEFWRIVHEEAEKIAYHMH